MSRIALQTVVGVDWPTNPGVEAEPTWPLADLLAGAASTHDLFARSTDRLAGVGLRLALGWSPYYGIGQLSAAREYCHAVGLDKCGLDMDPAAAARALYRATLEIWPDTGSER